MGLLRAWRLGYARPRQFAEELARAPAPRTGFWAQLLRAGLDAALLYLPLALLGRVPPEPSYLPPFPTETYYATLVWLAPVVLAMEWLLASAAMHVALRLAGRPSQMDVLLNVNGVTALVVGAALLAWDWTWVALGGVDQVWLGVSHLVIDAWGVVLTAFALRRVLGTPLRIGALLAILGIAAALPLAMVVMRSPL